MNHIFKEVLQKFPGENETEILKVKLFKSMEQDGEEELTLNDVLTKKSSTDKVYKMLSEGEKFRFVSLKIQTQAHEKKSTISS